MKTLVSLIILTFSLGAFAQTENHWSYDHRTVHHARNYRQYEALRAKYPHLLKSEDPRSFKNAALEFHYFVFTGPTTCAPEDERLRFMSHALTVCHKNNSCRSYAPVAPYGDQDPCLE